jgi:WD40 repeat protein/tRNA A-37 threonylcarbamoyl transferase component Bud32
MTPEQFQQASALFLRACEADEAQRARLLDDGCGDDAEVRAAVESWLAEDDRPHAIDEGVSIRAAAAVIKSEALALPSDEPPPPMERVGRYRIIRKIGEGGMGVVYEAEQEEPKRRVALKVVRPGAVTHQLLKRFRQEIRLLGQLRHPGIGQIYDAGATDEGEGGRPFFAMELVTGRPLIEYAKAHDLGARVRMELIARICDALDHAHGHGVVHRDLKPGNILIEERIDRLNHRGTEGGQPKILDFGVARATDADIRTVTLQTDVGQLVGTVPYMSPEQAAGDPAAIDHRSDVYSLGVITFELLTGCLPYDLDGKLIHEAVRIVREEEPSRMSSVNRIFRGDVETIVAKALEKDKQRRYQSAAEMAADIRRYFTDQPIVARPASAIYQLRKFVRRNKALAAGVAIAFATILVATAVSTWQWRVAEHQRALAHDRADALEESAWQAYRHSIESASSALELGDPLAASRFLRFAAPEHVNWEHRYLAARLDPCAALVELPEPVAAAGLAVEELQLITVVASGIVQQWDPYLGEVRQTVQLDAVLTGAAALSGDGHRIVGVIGAEADSVAVWDTRTGHRVATLTGDEIDAQHGDPEWRPIQLIAVSPGGDRIAVGGHGTCGGAFVWETAGTGEVRRSTVDRATALAFDPDGRWLAFGSVDTYSGWAEFREADLEGKEVRAAIPWRASYGAHAFVNAVAYEGQRRIVICTDSRAQLHDRITGDWLRTLGESNSTIAVAAVGPGGRLAIGSADGTVRVWTTETGEKLRVLLGHTAPVRQISFSREGSKLLSVADRTVRIFDLDADDRERLLRSHNSYVYGVAFTGNGSRIVSAAWDGDLRFWDAETGSCMSILPSGREQYIQMDAALDAPLVATGHEHEVRLWDADSRQHLRDIRLGGRATALDVADDGSRVAVRTRSEVSIWGAQSGERILEIAAGGSGYRGAVALGPSGALIAADGGWSDALMWDARSGEALHRLAAARVLSLSFSPDGSMLAAGSDDGVVRLFDVARGTEIFALEGHQARVYALAFSHDGSRLASGSDDRTIRLWDARRGEAVLTMSGHDDYVYSLAFSPDGSMLVSGSGDHTVRIWDTRPARERHRTRARTGGPD